jgi:hypothetical protein
MPVGQTPVGQMPVSQLFFRPKDVEFGLRHFEKLGHRLALAGINKITD